MFSSIKCGGAKTRLATRAGAYHPVRLLIKELDTVPDLGNLVEMARRRVEL